MANINKNEIGYNENTTANALMVQYKRGLAAPIDISEVFTSLESARLYASSDPIAYAGQSIAVAGEGIKTEIYKITSGSTLVKLVDEDTLINFAAKNDVPISLGNAENSAVLKGGENQVTSEGGVALGKNNLVNGIYSYAEGIGNKTNNDYEHASGKYNISTPKTVSNTIADATHFSIGIGTESVRKNAVEVKQNGDVYITGIGGFDGINYDNAKSVQDTIRELTETVQNLSNIIKQITLTEE